jgi:hypothetical protein
MRFHAVWVTAAAAAVLTVTGCASPEYRYVASPDDNLVLKVPANWSPLDAKKVAPDSVGATAIKWLAFYDGSDSPKVANAKVAAPTSPLAVVESFQLTASDLAQIDDDALRNIARPITQTAQAQDALERKAAGLSPQTIQVMVDEQVRTKLAAGVHVEFAAGQGTEKVHYDQVGVIDRKAGRAHFLVIKCSEACYQANQRQIEAVAQSFTVKHP